MEVLAPGDARPGCGDECLTLTAMRADGLYKSTTVIGMSDQLDWIEPWEHTGAHRVEQVSLKRPHQRRNIAVLVELPEALQHPKHGSHRSRRPPRINTSVANRQAVDHCLGGHLSVQQSHFS